MTDEEKIVFLEVRCKQLGAALNKQTRINLLLAKRLKDYGDHGIMALGDYGVIDFKDYSKGG